MAINEKSNRRNPEPAGRKPETASKRYDTKTVEVVESEFALASENYKLLAISSALIILGLLLMVGSDDIFSFRKITLSVIVIMAGFIFGIYAIMKRPKE